MTALSRRGLFGVLAGAIAAPMVVRSGILMPIRAIVPAPLFGMFEWGNECWNGLQLELNAVRREMMKAHGLPSSWLRDDCFTKWP